MLCYVWRARSLATRLQRELKTPLASSLLMQLCNNNNNSNNNKRESEKDAWWSGHLWWIIDRSAAAAAANWNNRTTTTTGSIVLDLIFFLVFFLNLLRSIDGSIDANQSIDYSPDDDVCSCDAIQVPQEFSRQQRLLMKKNWLYKVQGLSPVLPMNQPMDSIEFTWVYSLYRSVCDQAWASGFYAH